MDDAPFTNTKRLGQHLERRYAIRPTTIDLLDAGGVFRVDRADGPSWVARVFARARPLERAEGDAEVLRFLEEQAYPAERCAHDDPVSELDGRAVLVTGHVDGTPPGHGGRSNVFPWVFEVLGELLATLHMMGGLSGALKRDAGSWHGDPRHEGLPRQDIAAAGAWLDEVEQRVPAAGREPFDLLREHLADADDCGDLPRCLVHPDFVPVNAIESSGMRLTIVDWTGSGLGPRIASLANLLWSVVGKHEGTEDERVDAVVAGYRRHVDLEDDELSRLADAMWIRPLLFACWYYRSSVGSGYVPTGREPWWPDRKPVNRVTRSARAAFKAESLPRPDKREDADAPKPEIPGQLSLTD